MGRAGILVALLLPLLVACGNGRPPTNGVGAPSPAVAPAGDRVPGEYLVLADPALDADALRARLAPYTVRAIRPLGPGRWQVRLEPDPGPAALAGALPEGLLSIQPNYRYRTQPAVPLRAE